MTPENNFDEKESNEEFPHPSPVFDDQPVTQKEVNNENGSDEALTTPEKIPGTPSAEQEKGKEQKKAPLTASEARTMASLAHLSVLLNLATGFLGIIAALVIYFVYKDRSRLVAYHAMQAFIFQALIWLGAGILAVIFITFGTAFFFLVIPLLCLIPGFLFLLAIPASLIYGVVGAVQVNNGEDFRYWQVGDWVRDILE